MNIQIQAIHFKADQKLKDYIEKKLEKLEMFGVAVLAFAAVIGVTKVTNYSFKKQLQKSRYTNIEILGDARKDCKDMNVVYARNFTAYDDIRKIDVEGQICKSKKYKKNIVQITNSN